MGLGPGVGRAWAPFGESTELLESQHHPPQVIDPELYRAPPRWNMEGHGSHQGRPWKLPWKAMGALKLPWKAIESVEATEPLVTPG